jgi:hypothetical protein
MKILKIIIFINLLVLTETTIAQDFEVSPASLKYIIDPFENNIKLVNITNHSNKNTLFKLSYADFIFNIEGKLETVAAKSTENSCIDWLMPDQDVFEIKPNETFQLKINMLVPTEDYKDRWGYIYIQTSREQTAFDVEKETSRTGLNMQARIAIEVIRIPKTQQQNDITINSLKEIEDIEKTEENKDKKIFTALVENKGTKIHECEVTFIASDLSNAKEYEFEAIKIKSYPGFPREVKFVLPSTLPNGEFSFAALLDYGNKAIIEGTRLNKSLIIVK